ncbi:ATP-grasp domain-containing protein [Alteribacillus sp. HJP-4]|uniref:ATP-grasp domain-containing protein n=1 Tax=Alteribacillus sp. HJP-4 TaxID=2775394 RepID=UPI0035CCF0E2
MNLLLCSAGRRVKLTEYFKEELNNIGGIVVAADCDSTAPALVHADRAEVVPRIDHPSYLPHLEAICKKHEITGILSLIDPELSLLAGYKDVFLKKLITPVVSSREVVDICFDKYLTYQFLIMNDLPAVPTFICMEDTAKALDSGTISFPLFAKPKNGSASTGVQKLESLQDVRQLLHKNENYIIQPFMAGDEIGIDCYADMISKKATHIFCKKKVLMRTGETDRSVSLKDPALLSVIERLIDVLQPAGPIDIDCFRTENGWLISEINPRFGGGYLHAHEAGQNFVRNIINNLNGFANAQALNSYEAGTTMVKFDNVMLLKNKVLGGRSIV